MLQNSNFPGSGGAYSAPPDPLADGEGARYPLPRTLPRSRPFGPCFYGSQGLIHYRVGTTLLMIDFKCRPM